jgi:ParB family chromosome partitioning protein
MAKKKLERKSASQETINMNIEKAADVLEALKKTTEESNNIITELDIASIEDPPFHDRRYKSQIELKNLSESIQATGGVFTPIIVRKVEGGYQRITGYRRIEASKIAGLKTIKAIVIDNIDDETAALIMITENLQREDPSIYDTTMGIMDMIKVSLKMSYQDVKKLIGRYRNYGLGNTDMKVGDKELFVAIDTVLSRTGKITIATLSNRLPMLEAQPLVSEYLSRGDLEWTHASLINRIKDEALVKELLEKVVAENLSKRQLQQLIATKTSKPIEQSFLRKQFKKISINRLDSLSKKKQQEVMKLLLQIEKIMD